MKHAYWILFVFAGMWLYTAVLPGVLAQDEAENSPKLISLKELGRHPLRVDVKINPVSYTCGESEFSTANKCLTFLSRQPEKALKDGLLIVSHDKRGDDNEQIRPLYDFADKKGIDVFFQPAMNKLPMHVQRDRGPFVYWHPAAKKE